MRRGSGDSQFRWLWGAFAVSTLGTWLAFDAFPIVAVLALHARPFQVSLLAAAGLGVSAVVAIPLGPWVERHRKRRVMIGMDCARFLALASVPVAYAFGWLRFDQLLVVAVVVGAADICFRAASGACLKGLVTREQLLPANARFESTTWTATMIGPPLGGALIAMFGPVTTVVADAVSYLLSALGITAIAGREPRPAPTEPAGTRRGEVLAGWRFILHRPALRALLVNTALANGLIMATAPLLAVLMLGRLHLPPWQYGLAFAAPCVGGLVGSRLARRLTARPASTSSCVAQGRFGRAGPSGWRSRRAAGPGSGWWPRSSSGSSPAAPCSTRSAPPTASSRRRPTGSRARSPPGASPRS